MARFVAAAVQMRSGVSPEANLSALKEIVGEAVSRGADYVQTPEMSGALQKNRADLMARLESGEGEAFIEGVAALAREHRIHLHLGSTPVALDGSKLANRAFLFCPDGRTLATYDKIHMFDVDLDNGESWRESAAYHPGETAPVVALPFAKLGLAICYDVRFPHLFRDQALAGAEVLTAPAAFTRQTGEAHWHVLQRARAIENGAYVISAAQGGRHEDGRETYGHSIIVDPWGRVLAEAEHDEPGVVVAEIETEKVAEARAKVPNLKNARAYEVEAVSAAGQEKLRA